jgi:transcriptional regulator with PAS, ATPase and Fis domain
MSRILNEIEETIPRSAGPLQYGTTARSPALVVALLCDDPHELPSRHSLVGLKRVNLGRGARRSADRDLSSGVLSIAVPDGFASASHAELRAEESTWSVVDTGSRNGVCVNGRPVTEAVLVDGDLIEMGHTLLLFRLYTSPVAERQALDFSPDAASDAMVTLSPELERELSNALHLAASSDLSLLILGESGTGKEVLARAMADGSKREGPFVGVNCGAIVPGLVESELFGHVRGAFTGAESAHDGLIRSAHRGTLFLDEIGDLELSAQAALLRVLQEREVRPVGSTRAVSVDVRLLAATHRDLEAMTASGAFREDLLSRLAGFRVRLPPLRERREDIGLLMSRLLGGPQKRTLRLEPSAAARLFYYSWPLNIRELGNVLMAARVLAGDGAIELQHLPQSLRDARPESKAAAAVPLTVEQTILRDELVALMRQYQGNVTAVARFMGKARTQVQRWTKRYGINPRDYRQ